MRINNISIEVLVNGTSITEYTKNNKIYLEGRKGANYTLRLRNHKSIRVLAIPSVDGLSVLNGKTATRQSSGYILDPYQTLDIDGWRINDDQVRAFQFTRKNASYGNKTGQSGNEGVIGLLVFNEKTSYYGNWVNIPITPAVFTYPFTDDNYTTDGLKNNSIDNWTLTLQTIGASLNTTRGMSSGQSSIAPDFQESGVQEQTNLGTGMGKKMTSHITKVEFNRETNPFVQIELYYFEKRQLERMGIIHKVPKGLPQAFPEEYCIEV